jgi:hypothetical protein
LSTACYGWYIILRKSGFVGYFKEGHVVKSKTGTPLYQFLVILIFVLCLPDQSLATGPISRSFGKLSLGMTLKDLEGVVEIHEIKEGLPHGFLNKGERLFQAPAVSGRRGIEGLYCLVYGDILYQIVIQYNRDYSSEITWEGFVAGILQRFGKPTRERGHGVENEEELEKLAPFALKGIGLTGLLQLDHVIVWDDHRTSLGLFKGKGTDLQEIDTNYIAIYSDNAISDKVHEKRNHSPGDKEESPERL